MMELARVEKLNQVKLTSAQSELRKAINKYEICHKLYMDSKKNSEEYSNWLKKEEPKEYKKIINQIVKQSQLDDLRSRISGMRKQDSELKQDVLERLNELNKSKKRIEECKSAVLNIEKKIEKYKEILIQESHKIKIVEDRQSENTLDEFSSITGK